MAKRKIPAHITNNDVRKYLAEINEHFVVLGKWHRKLIDKAKEQGLTKEEADLLKKVIKAYNNLNSQFDELTPSLVELVLRSKGL